MQTANNKKWAVPIFLAVMGGVYLAPFWAGEQAWAGVGAAAFMVAGALLLFGGRSEVVRVMRGQPADEMWRSFNLRAIWFASEVMAVVVVGAFV